MTGDRKAEADRGNERVGRAEKYQTNELKRHGAGVEVEHMCRMEGRCMKFGSESGVRKGLHWSMRVWAPLLSICVTLVKSLGFCVSVSSSGKAWSKSTYAMGLLRS